MNNWQSPCRLSSPISTFRQCRLRGEDGRPWSGMGWESAEESKDSLGGAGETAGGLKGELLAATDCEHGTGDGLQRLVCVEGTGGRVLLLPGVRVQRDGVRIRRAVSPTLERRVCTRGRVRGLQFSLLTGGIPEPLWIHCCCRGRRRRRECKGSRRLDRTGSVRRTLGSLSGRTS